MAVPVAAAAVIGVWLSTVMLARTSRMNAVTVFVALLFWGMVWGGWGLFLAFPIMATAKIVFGKIERLKPLALMMSD
jgi:predicted PurR-regulated permease PerM